MQAGIVREAGRRPQHLQSGRAHQIGYPNTLQSPDHSTDSITMTASPPLQTVKAARTSADEARERFDSAPAAAKYARGLNDTPSHIREVRCLCRALRRVPKGARVLDLPCGTGRLLPTLAQLGYEVTAADSSPHMLKEARAYAAKQGVSIPSDRYIVANALATGLSADAFDATVCNRLFHHFHEPQVRQDALRELRRITRGPIIVSFFNARTFLGQVSRFRNRLRRRPQTDRLPIMPGTFAHDAQLAGLVIDDWFSTRPGISKQCYAVLRRA